MKDPVYTKRLAKLNAKMDVAKGNHDTLMVINAGEERADRVQEILYYNRFMAAARRIQLYKSFCARIAKERAEKIMEKSLRELLDLYIKYDQYKKGK